MIRSLWIELLLAPQSGGTLGRSAIFVGKRVPGVVGDSTGSGKGHQRGHQQGDGYGAVETLRTQVAAEVFMLVARLFPNLDAQKRLLHLGLLRLEINCKDVQAAVAHGYQR